VAFPTRNNYCSSTMAKRLVTEVIHTGEKVDPRHKTADLPDNGMPKKAASRPGGAGNSASKRIRERPKVIDSTKKPVSPAAESTSLRNADLSSLEEELGLMPTPKAGESVAAPAKAPPPPPPSPPPAPAPVAAPAPAPVPAPAQAPEPVKVAPAPTPVPAPVPAPASASAPAKQPAVAVKKKKSKPVSPKVLSKEKAKTAVTSMVDQMKAKAQGNGGYLRTEDISAMESDFQAQVAQITESMELSFEAYVKARERAEWDTAREFPFGRVIVKKFSHLFKEPRNGRMDTVSKRMLPGFFSGLNMMVGPESVDLFQERCRRVVEKIRDQEGDDFDWDSVYASPDAAAIVIDALMSIAPHFDNFERRQEWLIELVNGHLAPVGEHEPDAGWELSSVGYKRFISALYADLHVMLGNQTTKSRIAKRYGSNAVEAVSRLIKRTSVKK
jgi:hypothetical protein